MDKVDNSPNSLIFRQLEPVIGLFAKQPIPGQVKTRLSPPLTIEQACELYRVSLQETVTRLTTTGFTVVICYSGERAWFANTFPDLPLLAQSGGGLSLRLSHAAEALFGYGAGQVMLAGTDSPDLPVTMVEQLAIQLQTVEIASIPCRDGGYAVIGMQKLPAGFFTDMPWSTSRLIEATRQRCRELGLSYFETDCWEDLDQVEDLQRLVARSPQAQTARYILDALAEFL